MRRLAILSLLLIMCSVLGGCVVGDDSPKKSESTQVNAPIDADISSGCWTAEQRGLAIDLEGGKNVSQWTQAPDMAIDTTKTYVATVNSDKGSFEITFFADEAPKTVNNFVCLAKSGFYDSTTFHRVVAGFVIQGGDPEGTGRGGPGYRFEDEPVKRDYSRGMVAMANAGPNTNGSQFFVCLQDVQLPKNYTIFGEVTKGMDVVDAIASVPTQVSPGSREQSSPIEPVTVDTVTISES